MKIALTSSYTEIPACWKMMGVPNRTTIRQLTRQLTRRMDARQQPRIGRIARPTKRTPVRSVKNRV
jgi:hypothetical protein